MMVVVGCHLDEQPQVKEKLRSSNDIASLLRTSTKMVLIS